jgi:hypothetical protein
MLLLALLACQPKPAPDDEGKSGEGLFSGGCPVAGEASARVLSGVDEAPWGPDALAAPGDILLVNERAAFVIQDPTAPRTYYHYGGMPIDAVAVDGCEQAGPEILGEFGLIVGQLDLVDFNSSSLHMVRGTSVEIVSDGRDGGPAIVDVHATDDRFWLVELTLMRSAWEGGGRKELGDLYGLDLTLRYTLAPGDGALQFDVRIDGAPAGEEFLVGAVLFPSDHTRQTAFASGDLGVGGIGLDVGVPWVEDGSATGSTAIAMPGGTLGMTEISGVTALLDIEQAAVPLGQGDEAQFVIGVGGTDGASAARWLEPWLDDPVPGFGTAWHDVRGSVTAGGAPAAGVEVLLETAAEAGRWTPIATMVTDATGAFDGRLLAVEGRWRLSATGEGRDGGVAVEVSPDAATAVALEVGEPGVVVVDATDDDGAPLPVRVELERDDGTVVFGYPTPQDPSIPVPPGVWTAYVTRGYEYTPVTTTVTVETGTPATLTATLSHVIDTSGWVSYDSHVHAGPSADSDVLPVVRMRTAAGSGLDTVISTDHEAIVDLSGAVTEAGLDAWVQYGLGSEVTASLPEHTNAWPFPTVDHVRGEPVVWYGEGFGGIYAAERVRGARVIQLNHSRVNGECGVLCILDWDRMTDPPGTDDPTALGLAPGEAVWSWDFDSFEVLNGLRSPYFTEDPRRSGALYDWLAFHNLGYSVAAVGVTDVHGMGTPGTPRTYAPVADETAFSADDLADATVAGATQVSAGAFVRASIDGAGPGALASPSGDAPALALEVQALPEIDVTGVHVLVDCDAYTYIEAEDPNGVVKLDTMVTLPGGADHHVVLIAVGAGEMPRGIEGYDAASVPRAIVSPIFVDGDGDGLWTPPGPKACDWRP